MVSQRKLLSSDLLKKCRIFGKNRRFFWHFGPTALLWEGLQPRRLTGNASGLKPLPQKSKKRSTLATIPGSLVPGPGSTKQKPRRRSEERRVGKECRSRLTTD